MLWAIKPNLWLPSWCVRRKLFRKRQRMWSRSSLTHRLPKTWYLDWKVPKQLQKTWCKFLTSLCSHRSIGPWWKCKSSWTQHSITSVPDMETGSLWKKCSKASRWPKAKALLWLCSDRSSTFVPITLRSSGKRISISTLHFHWDFLKVSKLSKLRRSNWDKSSLRKSCSTIPLKCMLTFWHQRSSNSRTHSRSKCGIQSSRSMTQTQFQISLWRLFHNNLNTQLGTNPQLSLSLFPKWEPQLQSFKKLLD